MRSEVRWFGRLAMAGALWFGVMALSAPTSAQQIQDTRVDLHPVGMQVGIVTGVKGDTAWVKLPHSVSIGAKVDFSLSSDGGDTLAVGVINWSSPIAPYEAYITDIKPVKKRFPINDYEDFYAVGAFKAEQTRYTLPFDDGNAAYLASGFYARTTTPGTSVSVETVEPVRACIGALRARNNKVALALAEVCERALVDDPNLPDADVPAEEAVNYTLLLDGLRRFQRLRIADTVTAHISQRLIRLARIHNGGGGKVPVGVLIPTLPTASGR